MCVSLALSLMRDSLSAEISAKLGVRLISQMCSFSFQSTAQQTLRSTSLLESVRQNRRESDCVKLNIPS